MQSVTAGAENSVLRTMMGLEVGDQKCVEPRWAAGERQAQVAVVGAGYSSTTVCGDWLCG